MVGRPAVDVECLNLAVLVLGGLWNSGSVFWGDRRLRRGHGLAKRGDGLDGSIGAGERRVEKGAGGGEEAGGAAEGGHCG